MKPAGQEAAQWAYLVLRDEWCWEVLGPWQLSWAFCSRDLRSRITFLQFALKALDLLSSPSVLGAC